MTFASHRATTVVWFGIFCYYGSQTSAMTPSFDYCFIGNDDQLNLSLAAPCPLIPRSEFKYESSCSVVLDEEGIHNQGCTPCFWKERIEPMCFPTTTENMHHCCCRTSDCNRRLMEDAILGWKTKTDIPEGYCKSAVLKMTDRGLKWTHRAPEKCRQGKSMCTVKVYFNSEAKENITGLESGCISDADWEEIRDDSISEKCQALSIEWLGIGANHSARCCTGKDCLRKFYRKEVFLKLQRMRLHEENEYMRLLDFEVSRKTEHIWAADQDYFAAQSIFEALVCVFCAIYLSGMYYMYVIYKPIPMEKRKDRNRLNEAA